MVLLEPLISIPNTSRGKLHKKIYTKKLDYYVDFNDFVLVKVGLFARHLFPIKFRAQASKRPKRHTTNYIRFVLNLFLTFTYLAKKYFYWYFCCSENFIASAAALLVASSIKLSSDHDANEGTLFKLSLDRWLYSGKKLSLTW